MSQGVEVAGIYVRDQDEALEFYVGKLGFKRPHRRPQRRLSLADGAASRSRTASSSACSGRRRRWSTRQRRRR